MIAAVDGASVMRFLERIKRETQAYSEIVICSPFIDPKECALIGELMELTKKNCCGLRVMSRRMAAQMILAHLPGWPNRQTDVLMVHPRLHAKVYMARRRDHDTEAIVTSANLTTAGLATNFELGVAASNTSPQGAELIDQIRSLLSYALRSGKTLSSLGEF